MAVYTTVSETDIQAFLESYDIGTLCELAPIAEGVENTNYRLTTSRGRFVLTLFERRTPAAALPYVVGLMRHLEAKGAPVPRPVRGKDGDSLRCLNARPALIVSFLEGAAIGEPDPAHCRAAGRALALLHLEGADYAGQRSNPFGPEAWSDIAARCGNAAHGDADLDALLARIDTTLGQLDRIWPSGLPSGPCHADLFPDNVFFRDREVSGIIDFYFACNEFWAYDLAVALVSWAFDRENIYRPDCAEAMIAGYDEIRTLDETERAALPTLCLGAATRFTLTRLYDRLHPRKDALVIEKNPAEFAARMSLFSDRIASRGDNP